MPISLTLPAAIVAALALAACTAGEAPPRSAGETAGEEVVIKFVRSGVRDFRADGDRAVYVQGGRGEWYYVRTLGPCPRLYTALSLGFETSAADQLDRHGAIIAEGVRCPVDSIVRSEKPPRRRRQ